MNERKKFYFRVRCKTNCATYAAEVDAASLEEAKAFLRKEHLNISEIEQIEESEIPADIKAKLFKPKDPSVQ